MTSYEYLKEEKIVFHAHEKYNSFRWAILGDKSAFQSDDWLVTDRCNELSNEDVVGYHPAELPIKLTILW